MQPRDRVAPTSDRQRAIWVGTGQTPARAPSHQPRVAASSPTTRLATTLTLVVVASPSSASRTVSYPNVENVVNAPQKPVPTRVSTQSDAPAATTPSTNEPVMLTTHVPQGNAARWRRWTATSVRERVGAPTAPPRSTRRSVIAAAARWRADRPRRPGGRAPGFRGG